MNLRNKTHEYAIIKNSRGNYQAMMIISELDSYEKAIEEILQLMKVESGEIIEKEILTLEGKGVKAVTLEEAIKNMTPVELESFIEERNQKFINPLMNKNIKSLERLSNKTKKIRLIK